MASVLHKELEYKAEKLKGKKVGGHADEPVIEPINWRRIIRGGELIREAGTVF